MSTQIWCVCQQVYVLQAAWLGTETSKIIRQPIFSYFKIRTVARSLTPSDTYTLGHTHVLVTNIYLTIVALVDWNAFNRILLPAVSRIPTFGHVSRYMYTSWILQDSNGFSEQQIVHRMARWLELASLAISARSAGSFLSARVLRSIPSSEQGLPVVLYARASSVFSVKVLSTWNGLTLELQLYPMSLHFCSTLTLRLLFLFVLKLRAPLSSFLEGPLYKCSICMCACIQVAYCNSIKWSYLGYNWKLIKIRLTLCLTVFNYIWHCSSSNIQKICDNVII